jgi:branched-chain amino acid transport system substrate-binding protein
MRTKQFKKLALVLALLVLTGSMAGCSKSDPKPADPAAPSTPAAADTIKLGLNVELSGAVASYGSNSRDGIVLAIEHVNAAGGVLGQQLEAIIKDDKSDTAESTSVAASWAGTGVIAQLGPLVSGNVKASVPILTEQGIPVVAPAATAANVTINNTGEVEKYAFRVCFIDDFQGTLMAQFALDAGYKSAAIYKDASSDYGKGLAKFFQETFEAGGGTIVADESFAASDQDFRAALNSIKGKTPDFIYVPGYYQEVALLIKQARELEITAPIGGCDGWDSPTMLEVAGADALNNTYFTNHYSSEDTDPKVVDFVATYQAKYNKVPDSFAALGYDAVMITVQALNEAGEATPAALTAALAQITDFQGVTGNMTIDANHNPIKAGVIIEFKDGVQVMNTRIQP